MAEELLRRLATYPAEHLARFLEFEREYLRRYRKDHLHDLGPPPSRSQCLKAFRDMALLRNQGHGAAEFARNYRQHAPSAPVFRLTYGVDPPDIRPVPEDEWMPTYRLLAEIEAAMDEERIIARQAPADDAPGGPLAPSDTLAATPPSEPQAPPGPVPLCDGPLLHEMQRMLAGGQVRSVYAAAKQVADRAPGIGSFESKQKRLTEKYQARYGKGQSTQE